ncbi:MAG: sigma-54 interaction domain-containing protein [Myxococcota bacterium]
MTRSFDPGDSGGRLGAVDAETLLANVLETTPGGLFTVDVQGRITSWNRAMETATGWPAREVLGSPCAVLQGSTCFRGPQAEEDNRCPLFLEGELHGRGCRITRRDGHQIPVVKHARLMRDEAGEVIGAIEAVTDVTDLVELKEEVARLRREVSGRVRFGRIVGHHPSMQNLYDMIEVAGRTSASVLIQGETGTGKELVARAVHDASDRNSGPFVRVSCAALSETLLESELFGHVKGAFTGATTHRKGRFEEAHGGTLFLDEIGDVSLDVQKKLLRALQEHEIERVGDSRPVPVDIRIIAATNRDLVHACEGGCFRKDLYYRLAVLPLQVPPLRERRSDIPLLVEWFLERLNERMNRGVAGVTTAAMDRLLEHSWPGNVRELEHAMEYAFAVTSGDVIGPEALPPTMERSPEGDVARSDEPAPAAPPRRPPHAPRRRGRPDRQAIEAALDACGGNKTRAAERLGVSRVTLWKWLKKLDG